MKKTDKMRLALGYCAIPEVRELMVSLGDELQDYVPQLLKLIIGQSELLYSSDTNVRQYSVSIGDTTTEYAVTTLSYFLMNELDPDEWMIGVKDQFSIPEALIALLPFRLTRPYSEPKMSMDWWKEAYSTWDGKKFHSFRKNLYTATPISPRAGFPQIYVDTQKLRSYLNRDDNWLRELDRGSLQDLLSYVRGCSMMVDGDIFIVIKEPGKSRRMSQKHKFIDVFKG